MKNEIIKLAQEKCKEYLKEKSITYHPSYVWLCQYIAEQVYEQMLKDAFVDNYVVHDGRIELEGDPLPSLDPILLLPYPQFKPGDKVRIIVIKEEE